MIQSEAVSNGNRGLLIVFEGINKMEIITQSKELLDFFNAHVSNSAESISFPSKQTLEEMDHLVIDIFNNDKRLKARAMHMVTSFGRWESREGILELLRQGRHVILQSYAFTDVALSLYADVPIEWVLIPDKGLPRPDVVFQIVKDYKELDEEEKKLQDKYRLFHGYRYWKTFSESEDLAENIVDYVKNIIKEYEKTSMDNFARNFYPDSIGEDLFMYNEV